MRELARIPKNTFYDSSFEGNKGNLTKLPVIICTVAGIVLGSLAFKFDTSSIGNNGWDFFKKATQEKTSTSATVDGSNRYKEYFFKLFGIDFYDPLTILNANYPYFNLFYKNRYPEYTAQLQREKQQAESAQSTQQTSPLESSTSTAQPEESSPQYQEVSSSITFEGDVEEQDEKNNSVVSSGKINIINQTKYSIDINKLLAAPLNLKADTKGPKIFVYHTHTTESFLKTISELNNEDIPSRTTNNKYNVVRVGEALTSNLEKYGIDVLQNKTIHDKDYNSSYLESLKTLTSSLKKYPSVKMTIDLHRDALGGEKLRVVKKIDGKDVAQIMFVVGTDSKLENTMWKENLKLAIKLQARLNEICPGLAKPIYISKNRYNQHLTNGSLIVEIGGDGNVIDECVRSTTYLARAIHDVLYGD